MFSANTNIQTLLPKNIMTTRVKLTREVFEEIHNGHYLEDSLLIGKSKEINWSSFKSDINGARQYILDALSESSISTLKLVNPYAKDCKELFGHANSILSLSSKNNINTVIIEKITPAAIQYILRDLEKPTCRVTTLCISNPDPGVLNQLNREQIKILPSVTALEIVGISFNAIKIILHLFESLKLVNLTLDVNIREKEWEETYNVIFNVNWRRVIPLKVTAKGNCPNEIKKQFKTLSSQPTQKRNYNKVSTTQAELTTEQGFFGKNNSVKKPYQSNLGDILCDDQSPTISSLRKNNPYQYFNFVVSNPEKRRRTDILPSEETPTLQDPASFARCGFGSG
jgi:hypothetical protein